MGIVTLGRGGPGTWQHWGGVYWGALGHGDTGGRSMGPVGIGTLGRGGPGTRGHWGKEPGGIGLQESGEGVPWDMGMGVRGTPGCH